MASKATLQIACDGQALVDALNGLHLETLPPEVVRELLGVPAGDMVHVRSERTKKGLRIVLEPSDLLARMVAKANP